MRFLNRKTELGLNVLQLMYTEKAKKQIFSAAELAGALKESELFIYQVLRELRAKSYVYGLRGAQGGYKLYPEVEYNNLKKFLEDFNRTYVISSILNTEAASEYANQRITGFLHQLTLKEIFEGRRAPRPLLSVRTSNPDLPGGAA